MRQGDREKHGSTKLNVQEKKNEYNHRKCWSSLRPRNKLEKQSPVSSYDLYIDFYISYAMK